MEVVYSSHPMIATTFDLYTKKDLFCTPFQTKKNDILYGMFQPDSNHSLQNIVSIVLLWDTSTYNEYCQFSNKSLHA